MGAALKEPSQEKYSTGTIVPIPSSCCVHRGISNPSPSFFCIPWDISRPSMGSRTALPWGRRFLCGHVSLCGVFGAGTTLTVKGESPTSPRSVLSHHGILTFCRFLVIWGFFLGLGAGLGSDARLGSGTDPGVGVSVPSLRTLTTLCAPRRIGAYFLNRKVLKFVQEMCLRSQGEGNSGLGL